MTAESTSLGQALNWRCFTFEVTPLVDYCMRALCARPYLGHKSGCPKFNKGLSDCPPGVPYFDKYFDMTAPIFAIVNEFDMQNHIETLGRKHPTWTDRQLRCCLYWQATARKQLGEKINQVLSMDQFRDYHPTSCPEAMGINVTETLKKIGIILQWPPITIARQVALIGKILILS